MGHERPDKLNKAVFNDDFDHLSAAGRKGAEAAHQKRQARIEIDEIFEERQKEKAETEELARLLEANEHIIDPDGNATDYTDRS